MLKNLVKLLILFLFVFSLTLDQFIFASTPCLSEQVSQIQIEELDKLLQTYDKTESNAGELRIFLKTNSTPLSLTIQKEAILINDIKGKPLEKNTGMMNKGIYLYEKDSSKRLIKIIDPIRGGEVIAEQLSEVYFSLVAQKMGGPKIFSFGTVQLKGKENVYIEMEHLFAGEPSLTLKNALGPYKGKLFENFFASSSDARDNFTSQTADLYFKALLNKIIPLDTDIIFNPKGEVRFIDSGLWEKAPNLKSIMIRSFIPFVEDMKQLGSFATIIKVKLAGKIKASDKFSEQEKNELLSFL